MSIYNLGAYLKSKTCFTLLEDLAIVYSISTLDKDPVGAVAFPLHKIAVFLQFLLLCKSWPTSQIRALH